MFLRCTPSVFVIGDEYEILLWTKTNGVVFVRIGGKAFYEKNSGVLSSEKSIARIRVPQSVLDETKIYEIVFRETIQRKAYYSELSPEKTLSFAFKPLEKTEDIHVYHIADVHYHFETAIATASYFSDDTDLFVVNGDIGEVETEENYFEVAKFVGDIAQGRVPVLFVRGNHDTRGKLAERYIDIFPNNYGDTFFTFSLGCLKGVALDCGEDKRDYHLEYGGVNVFEVFRQRESAFLKSISWEEDGKIPFAVSHICPVFTTYEKGGVFDIERERYAEWNQELERLGIRFMLNGHMHRAHILDGTSKLNTLPHQYPVIIGSACLSDTLWGTALILNKDKMEVLFTDKDRKAQEKYQIVF